MNDLTKKGVMFKWGLAQETAFQTLKTWITSSPVLTQPDPTKPYHLKCDASGFATGAILSQQQEDGLWRPVGFISALMTEQQRNYDIFDKEMLAIINALEVWRHLLEGATHLIDILSDHRNLTYWTTAWNLTRHQARWALYLS